jgi:phytoene dehydrogenase-like protein
MYVLAGMLLLGLLCNLLIRPVDPKHHMTEEQLAKERAAAPARPSSSATGTVSNLTPATASNPALLVLAWVAVGLPLAWGGWVTLSKALVLFK